MIRGFGKQITHLAGTTIANEDELESRRLSSHIASCVIRCEGVNKSGRTVGLVCAK